jgi:choline kinase
MRAIILAAGQGSRLRPLTNDRPKAMIEVAGRTLLDRQISTFKSFGIQDIAVVTGYCSKAVVAEHPVQIYFNDRFATTNMVYSLICAKDFLVGDTIISYGDILYEDRVLESLLANSNGISVVVDLDWKDYYAQRFTNPYDDAESLIYRNDNQLISIGKSKPTPKDVMGQYIGLIKISAAGIHDFLSVSQSERHSSISIGWGRPYEKAYMTDYLQELINRNIHIHAVPIRRGWYEIDHLSDYDLVLNDLKKQE